MTFDALSAKAADTMTDLRANQGSAGDVCYLRGFYTDLDGGGGWFSWSTDTTTADDGGVVIVPSGQRTGCWKRQNAFRTDRAVNALWFGALGDGSTDNAPFFTKLLAYVASVTTPNPIFTTSPGCKVYFPRGLYKTSQTLKWSNGVIVTGDGNPSTIWFSNVVNGVETFVGDGFLVTNEPNGNASGGSKFCDLCLVNASPVNNGTGDNTTGGFTMIGGGGCYFHRCTTVGWANHYLFVGAEICDVIEPYLGGGAVPNEKATGVVIMAGIRGFTSTNSANCIYVLNGQFNGPGLGVRHGDGVSHAIVNCNFESARVAQIAGTESVLYQNITIGDAPASGDLFSVGPGGIPGVACIGLSIKDSWLQSPGAIVKIDPISELSGLSLDGTTIASCGKDGVVQGVRPGAFGGFSYTGVTIPAGTPLTDGPVSGQGGTFVVSPVGDDVDQATGRDASNAVAAGFRTIVSTRVTMGPGQKPTLIGSFPLDVGASVSMRVHVNVAVLGFSKGMSRTYEGSATRYGASAAYFSGMSLISSSQSAGDDWSDAIPSFQLDSTGSVVQVYAPNVQWATTVWLVTWQITQQTN